MKVKIFEGAIPIILEKEINNFLVRKCFVNFAIICDGERTYKRTEVTRNIVVKYLQSECADKIIITLFYNEPREIINEN